MEKGHPEPGQAEMLLVKWLMLLQLQLDVLATARADGGGTDPAWEGIAEA